MNTLSPKGRDAWWLPGPHGATRVRRITPARLAPHLDALTRLAHATFTPRPWHAAPADIARLINRLTIDAHQPGFRLLLADDAAGHLVGFAYGRPACHLAALADQPPVGRLPFELRELAVTPSACGHGIGAALHDALLTTAPPGPRWLLTHPHAAPALALYRARGWRTAKLLRLPDSRTRILMHRPW